MELTQIQTKINVSAFQQDGKQTFMSRRKPEVDLLTDDHIRQMLGSVGAYYQSEDMRRRKVDNLIEHIHQN